MYIFKKILRYLVFVGFLALIGYGYSKGMVSVKQAGIILSVTVMLKYLRIGQVLGFSILSFLVYKQCNQIIYYQPNWIYAYCGIVAIGLIGGWFSSKVFYIVSVFLSCLLLKTTYFQALHIPGGYPGILICCLLVSLISLIMYPLISSIVSLLNKVCSYIIPWDYIAINHVNTDLTIEDVDRLGEDSGSHSARGDAFEDFTAELHRKAGYKAHTVAELKAMGIYPRLVNPNVRADKGLDVVVWKGSNTIVLIQCKLYKAALKSEVIYEVRKAENNWKECFPGKKIEREVWTNSTFTEDALQEAIHEKTKCIDRTQLQHLMKNMKPNGNSWFKNLINYFKTDKMLKTGKTGEKNE